jgi:hypothetical protein
MSFSNGRFPHDCNTVDVWAAITGLALLALVVACILFVAVAL